MFPIPSEEMLCGNYADKHVGIIYLCVCGEEEHLSLLYLTIAYVKLCKIELVLNFFKQMKSHSGFHFKKKNLKIHGVHYGNKLEINHHLKYDPNIHL